MKGRFCAESSCLTKRAVLEGLDAVSTACQAGGSDPLAVRGCCWAYLGRGSVGEQLVAGQVVLLLHGAAEDLLHAAGDHRDRCYRRAQHVLLHLQIRDGPVTQQGARHLHPHLSQALLSAPQERSECAR